MRRSWSRIHCCKLEIGSGVEFHCRIKLSKARVKRGKKPVGNLMIHTKTSKKASRCLRINTHQSNKISARMFLAVVWQTCACQKCRLMQRMRQQNPAHFKVSFWAANRLTKTTTCLKRKSKTCNLEASKHLQQAFWSHQLVSPETLPTTPPSTSLATASDMLSLPFPKDTQMPESTKASLTPQYLTVWLETQPAFLRRKSNACRRFSRLEVHPISLRNQQNSKTCNWVHLCKT